MNLNNRKTLLLVLFFTAFILLIANVTFNMLDGEKESGRDESVKKDFAGFFEVMLKDYGIEESSIKVNQKNEDDTTYFIYNILIPQSFPIALFVNDIENMDTDEKLSVESFEKGIGGSTEIWVRGKGRVINALFKFSKDVKREGDTLNVFVDCSSLNEEEILKLVKESVINFSVLLKPSVNSQVIAAKILGMKKNYNLVFDDNIPELKYKLEAGYTQSRIFQVMNNLNIDFPEAKYFYIGDTPELNTVPISKEATKFNKIVLNNVGIKLISGIEDLDFLFKRSDGWKRFFLVIEPDEFKECEEELLKLVKRGDKILN